MKQKATIKNWRIENLGDWYFLAGKILNHSRQTDFKTDEQMTSKLLSIDFKNKTAETLNTIYTLEEK